MSDVGDGINSLRAGWSFGGETANTFDRHVSKSVPFYHLGQKLVCDISDYFIKDDGSVCYDIGSSTGELTLKLAKHHETKETIKFIGIDTEPKMIEVAEKKQLDLNLNNVSFLHDDVMNFNFENTNFISSYYTVQFIKPSERQRLVNNIFQSLNWGGGFLMFEKVRAPDARFQDMMLGLYDEYKLEAGYSPEEIFGKTRSLRGVLEPFSTQGNLDMLKRAGFKDVLTVMKFISFEGYLAIK